MKHPATIRSTIEDYIQNEKINLQRLANQSNLNAGTLSAILRANRPIAMRQLDHLTAGMGLPEGDLYHMYIDECLNDHNPNWRRIRPFLIRCAELDKLDCIRQILSHIMDNLAYVPLLFETAEKFFQQGKHAAARILYENVAESERYQHSERLAVCQYRLFTMAKGMDQQANLRAAVVFEGYVDRLCVEDQLEALRQLTNMYYSLRYWDKVQYYAAELGKKARILYYSAEKKRKNEQTKTTPQPVFVYILYSYLAQGAVCLEKRDYEQAISYTRLYADVSWVRENTPEAEKHKRQYQDWAMANAYMYNLLMGNSEVLPAYIAFLKDNEHELLTAMVRIMEAANRYQLDVDYIFETFKDQLSAHPDNNYLSKQIKIDQYTKYLAEAAIYFFKKEQYAEGMKYIMDCLTVAHDINNYRTVVRCIKIFEQYRQHAEGLDILQKLTELTDAQGW